MIVRSKCFLSAGALIAVLALLSCGEVKTPSRDNIPLIKERIGRLQQGILDKNMAAIDSLMSVDILKDKLSSDSLLKFVYGPDGSFHFKSFGETDIVYTDKFAKVECFVQDSTRQVDRPLTLTFTFDSDQWLLSRFEVGSIKPSDSI